MDSKFKAMFQISTRCINQAAIARAAGYHVEVVRQAGSRRAVFYFDDVPETRELIDQFERRQCLPLPAKTVLNARTQLYHEAAKAVREGV